MAALNTCISLVTAAALLVSARSGVLCAPLCLTGDFDSQLWHILHEQMLSPRDHIISRALDDVQATWNQRWQGYELIFCGSLAAGFGTITSDIDFDVNIPNFNASAGLYVLQETKKLFNKQPELYTALRYRNNVHFTMFAFFHIPSHRKVEILFRAVDSGSCRPSSQLVRYYFQLDKRFLPLGGFLKYFFSMHEITGHGNGFLSGYGLYMLIIFYLQQKNMAPTGHELQVNSKSYFIEDWDVGFNELPYISTNTESLHQLLGGFFKYYSEFNFEEYIVSPFTGRPIPRSAFIAVNNFPKEYTLYNKTLKHSKQIAIQNDLNLTTDLCIQDIFFHDLNTGQLMTHEGATKFKHLMKSVATMFENLPGESILGAILVMDQPKKKVICHEQSSAGGRHEHYVKRRKIALCNSWLRGHDTPTTLSEWEELSNGVYLCVRVVSDTLRSVARKSPEHL